jgi:hypothetical protein
LQGPTQVVNRLVRCPDASCESRGYTFSPEAELSISMPRWCLGWDVFCWLGHRRFARHWSVPQLRAELKDTHQIRLSDDAIEHYIDLYQTMLAARQQDPAQLAEAYRDIPSLVLTIDGLQPEKGHETLYVVRELMRKRVWFAEPLLSSATPEVRRLIVVARQWAERLDKPVRGWMSDKQDAFVKAIASEFPGTPHRYCYNHFLRDLAQPVLEMDSRAKVKMRRKLPPHPKRRRRPGRRATSACPLRIASLRRRVGPRLGKRAWRTRWERSCSGIVRRCGVFLTTARVVRFTRPVYGCVRPYRTYATRWSATCKPKKGACRVVVETPGRLH